MRINACLIVTFTVALAAPLTAGPQDQRELAQRLLSSDKRQQREALATVRTLDAQNVDENLRTALLKLLEQQNRQRREMVRTGQGTSELPESAEESAYDPEFRSRVTQTVAELKDPRAIPLLVDSMGSGWVLHRTLAAFGEPAATAIIAAVAAPTTPYEAVNEGLIALRFLVEDTKRRPLSPTTLQGIRKVAQQHLDGPGRPAGTGVTLRWAIDLAVATGDAALRRVVESLASNTSEIVARGITDPALIEQTRQRALDRLGGVPALPQR
jgi:hypothetical protein